MQMDLTVLNKVWDVKPLKMTGEKEARRILEDVSNHVQPIMQKHKWKVQVLSEFCPSNPSLMGLNIGGGAEIKLRLRRPERRWDFSPFEQILDTMLHELCHNEHGPHDAEFYKLLDELRLECEELMAKGNRAGTGRGYDLPGKRLGGFSQPSSLPLIRQNASAAAERRAQHGTLLPSGPRRMGGDSNIKTALSPIQAAAMAAERRLHDDVWCGSHSIGTRGQQSSNNASSSRESQDPISNVQSLPPQGKIENQETWQCSMCTLTNKPLARVCEACQTPRSKEVGQQSNNYASPSRETRCPISNVQSQPPQGKTEGRGTWQCLMCTLINKPLAHVCEACQTPRSKEVGEQSNNYASSSQETRYPISNVQSRPPQGSTEGQGTWQCLMCTLINKRLAVACEACQTPRSKEVEQSISGWSCKFCTLINDSKLDKCSACGEWRYSYDPPASSYTPHAGT